MLLSIAQVGQICGALGAALLVAFLYCYCRVRVQSSARRRRLLAGIAKSSLGGLGGGGGGGRGGLGLGGFRRADDRGLMRLSAASRLSVSSMSSHQAGSVAVAEARSGSVARPYPYPHAPPSLPHPHPGFNSHEGGAARGVAHDAIPNPIRTHAREYDGTHDDL